MAGSYRDCKITRLRTGLEAIPDFVVHWTQELGASADTVERLQGGINSRVFRCSRGDDKWVIKGYVDSSPRSRERMMSEIEFLRFAGEVAAGFTPNLIHADQDRLCVVLENLDGQPFEPGVQPPQHAVREAVRFMGLLNLNTVLAKKYIQHNAAEGFLSLREHLANVEDRLHDMSYRHLSNKQILDARELLEYVRNRLDELKENTLTMISRGIIQDAIKEEDRYVSPSDFGFHNAISTSDGIKFFDFEFAGWDDPAKINSDFILQPRMPLQWHGLPLLSAWDTEQQELIKARCQLLLPILRLKWICIILSVLNPRRLDQILAAAPEEQAKNLVTTRIEKARLYMHRLREN